MEIDTTTLLRKPNAEFGEAAGNRELPPMEDYKFSVVYSLSDGDDAFLGASLLSVVKHFPQALEVVLVVSAPQRVRFYDLIMSLPDVSAAFQVRFVADTGLPPNGGLRAPAGKREALKRLVTWRRMNSDKYCSGNYVLHLDPSTVLFMDVTYDRVFHFNKLVTPYRRHPHGECKSCNVVAVTLHGTLRRGDGVYIQQQ